MPPEAILRRVYLPGHPPTVAKSECNETTWAGKPGKEVYQHLEGDFPPERCLFLQPPLHVSAAISDLPANWRCCPKASRAPSLPSNLLLTSPASTDPEPGPGFWRRSNNLLPPSGSPFPSHTHLRRSPRLRLPGCRQRSACQERGEGAACDATETHFRGYELGWALPLDSNPPSPPTCSFRAGAWLIRNRLTQIREFELLVARFRSLADVEGTTFSILPASGKEGKGNNACADPATMTAASSLRDRCYHFGLKRVCGRLRW